MKKNMFRITIVVIIMIMVTALVGCGEKEVASKDYKADEVKNILIETLDVDGDEVSVEDSDIGTFIGYGDWGTWFDVYILNDPKDALDKFEFLTLAGDFDDKRVDKKNHKLWVEEITNDFDEDDTSYVLLAMKGNLVFSIHSGVEPEVIIKAFDLD